MTSYNHIERAIAKILSKNSSLKKLAKYVYSRWVFIYHKKRNKFQTDFALKSYEADIESFFGYYDKPPANESGLVLAHLSIIPTVELPRSDKCIEVALFSPGFMKKLWSVKTAAYNWQQGARLHWLSDELFVYNDFDAEKRTYVSKVVSSVTFEQVKEFDYAVQDSFGTDYFFSINYRRLMVLRPDYGYRNCPVLTEIEIKSLDNDGIWKVDYQSGDAILLISLQQMCLESPRDDFGVGMHKVNHLMISPDGSQFIFLHRYLVGQRRFDRLFLADSHTGEFKILSEYGMVSHCFWLDDRTLLGYLTGPKNKDAYWLVDVQTGVFRHFPALDRLGDGHPHVCGDYFVTDTYPDKARMQHLNLVNWKTGEVIRLGEFFHDFEYDGETRCDLHPRFSCCGNKVYFDSVFSGKRKLYEMDLEF
jgi:hypothetical protein